METRTGEIKAITNLRRQDKDNAVYSETMEYALNAKVEPGSTFKLASLLAFLEKMPSDTDRIYPMFVHTFKYPLKSGNYRSYYKADSRCAARRSAPPTRCSSVPPTSASPR
jgi:cell division protein FtsI/penicillin-binding protein 2